jgi:uncharacterized membrane protein
MLSRRHDISRLEAFSDAVFAFALTLLVVALEVPKSYDELMELVGGFLSFACCFSVLVWIWYEHNLFFRRYGLQDPYTVFLYGGLLFVVLFYVYPLKFMFDSWFARFSTLPHKEIVPMSLTQLSSASAVYGLGFFLLFIMFGLLYLHAYRKRHELGLTPVEVFDVRIFLGQHMVSAAVGLIALGIALFGPRRYGFLSPMAFALMGPAHWSYQVWIGKKRKAFEAKLPPPAPSPISSPSPLT